MIRIPKLNNRTTELLEKRIASSTAPIAVSAKVDDTQDLTLYDEIGVWGTSTQSFNDALAQITAKNVNLRVNSPGGDVFAGIAMMNALKKHPANVVAHVEGLAASAASVVILGADQIRMNQGSFLMIHNVWTVIAGNANEMRDLADTLDKIDGALAGLYADKSGRKADTMKGFMDAETWFSAQEAVDNKLADAVDEQPAAKADFDLTLYNHVPDPLKASSAKAHTRKLETVRDLECLIRDEAGLSAADAKKFIANLRSPRLRDEDLSDLDAVLKSFRS